MQDTEVDILNENILSIERLEYLLFGPSYKANNQGTKRSRGEAQLPYTASENTKRNVFEYSIPSSREYNIPNGREYIPNGREYNISNGREYNISNGREYNISNGRDLIPQNFSSKAEVGYTGDLKYAGHVSEASSTSLSASSSSKIRFESSRSPPFQPPVSLSTGTCILLLHSINI